MSIRTSALALLVLAPLACRGGGSPVRIGVVLGPAGVHAAELAIAEIQAAAGPARVELQIVPYLQTSATAPLEAIAAAEALSADPSVVAVVGHGNSAASIAAAQVYNAYHLPQLAPTTTAPLYTEAGPYSYRMVPDDREQGRFLARVLQADPARRRVAVVYVNDDYGRGLVGALREGLRGSGVQVVSETPVLEEWQAELLGLTARAVADARPQVVVWLARPAQLLTFRRALLARLPGVQLLSGDAADNPMMYQPGQLGDFGGVRFVRFLDPYAPHPALQAFRARFQARTQQSATAEAVLAYDAVKLVGEAVLAGARDRRAVAAYLASVRVGRPPFAGIGGPVSFDARRAARRPYLLAEVGPGDSVRPVPGF